MKRTTPRAGFTLIEIITVLAVVSVVSTLGSIMFFKMTSAWLDVHGRSELDAKADTIFASMQRDFDAVLSEQVSGVALRGKTDDAKSKEFFDRVLATDSIILPVRDAARTPAGRDESGLIMYRVDRSNGNATLMRTTGALDSQQPTNNPSPIATGVLRFQVEYTARTGGDQWTRGWNGPELPAAVRISLTLMDPDRSQEDQVARVMVFPIHVQ